MRNLRLLGLGLKKTAYLTPPPELVSAYLQEIAKGYGIDWAPEETKVDNSEANEDADVLVRP